MKKTIDKSKFKEIFESYYHEIIRFLYYKSGDLNLAEDIVQDVFFILWEKRSTVRLETVRAYLYKIATNIFISKKRMVKLEFNFCSSLSKKFDSESPEFIMEFNEFNVQFQKALAILTEKQRVVLLMNRIEGLSYTKIAERLSISVKTVEKRMKLALGEMDRQLKMRV